MAPYNSFQIITKARSLSHASPDQWWNPYRRIAWGKRNRTWDAADLERNEENPRVADPKRHRTTPNDGPDAPNGWSSQPPRNMPTDLSTADTMTLGTGEANGHKTNGGAAPELRQRRPEEKSDLSSSPPNTSPTRGAEESSVSKKKAPKEKQGLIRHVQPKTPFTVANQLQRTLLNSWINLLLIAAPVGIALNYVHSVNKVVVFVVNFIAIIPLAAMLSFATEEIALRTGETLGGLLNATFGNAVELIVAIIALIDKKFRIVQTSLIGSILSNLLLVMGFCFFFGGLRREAQYFNVTVALTSASLLALAAASVIVPTVFDVASKTSISDVAKLSRGTSVILLLVYAAYLFFQLKTHSSVFSEESQKVPAKPWRQDSIGPGAVRGGLAMPGGLMGPGMPNQTEHERLSKMLMDPPTHRPDGDEEDEEEPQLHFVVAFFTLGISTAIIALCAEYMVDSIDAVTKQGGLSEEFVGLILLPIVGNAAEHATAVTVAIKDKMDLAIGVAVGSSMQVALFLIPLLVVIGWGMGLDEMNLSFDIFQVAVMFVAVLLTNYLIADGKSHWLEGFLLICLYAIIATCAFWYPDESALA
ncbi:sodium/calcium exchanger protein [Sarocladium implicatum]|nr:sodium/calcium exchanger protein [Sarocladium implicatum]